MSRSRGFVASAMAGLMVLAGSVQVAHAALPLKAMACGAKVKASFRLANDLDCAGTGLKVRKAGVVIHLNGHTISGAGDVGIDNSNGFARVTIKKGVITGFDTAIEIGRTNQNTVQAVLALSNSFDGIVIERGTGHRIIRSEASENGEQGIVIKGGSGHKIIGTEVISNGEQGIRFRGKDSTIRGVLLQFNGEDGLLAVIKAGMKILENEAIENGDDGIDVRGQGATISGNFACGNGEQEINVVKAGNVIKDNQTQAVCQ